MKLFFGHPLLRPSPRIPKTIGTLVGQSYSREGVARTSPKKSPHSATPENNGLNARTHHPRLAAPAVAPRYTIGYCVPNCPFPATFVGQDRKKVATGNRRLIRSSYKKTFSTSKKKGKTEIKIFNANKSLPRQFGNACHLHLSNRFIAVG